MDQSHTLTLFKEKDALLEGHFILSSGLHSNRYLQSALLLQYPDIAENLGRALANHFSDSFNVVVSPALGGLIIGQEVARAKGCRAIFSEKNELGEPVLRRGFSLSPSDRALIVEDVITTGLSTGEVIKLVRHWGALVIGVASIVDRSQGNQHQLESWNIPVHSLLKLEVQTWDKSACPLCRQGQPLVKPGSRKLNA